MKRAVIIDDEDLSIKLMINLIKRNNFPIDVCGQALSGDAAIEIINKTKPDIVFLDIQMPGCSGLEVMSKINSSKSKIIVITAYSYFEYAQSALRLGAKDILLKPIDSKQFCETMERVFGYEYTDNDELNLILEYINDNYHGIIELNMCARLFHINPNQLARLFKKYFDISFTQYVNKVRITKAHKLLSETILPIKDVAYRVGYNNLNYFYRNYKLLIGVTPKETRKTDY